MLGKTAVVIGLAIASIGFNAQVSQSASIAYTFQGTANIGAFTGSSYAGFASFDNAGITGIGFEPATLSSLSFNFLSSTFTLADGNAPPIAAYLDGSFVGVEYAVSVTNAFFPVANFALTTGFSLDDAAFIYTPRFGASGQGSLTYTLTSVTLTSVPEPSTVFSVIVLGGVALIIRKRI